MSALPLAKWILRHFTPWPATTDNILIVTLVYLFPTQLFNQNRHLILLWTEKTAKNNAIQDDRNFPSQEEWCCENIFWIRGVQPRQRACNASAGQKNDSGQTQLEWICRSWVRTGENTSPPKRSLSMITLIWSTFSLSLMLCWGTLVCRALRYKRLFR